MDGTTRKWWAGGDGPIRWKIRRRRSSPSGLLAYVVSRHVAAIYLLLLLLFFLSLVNYTDSLVTFSTGVLARVGWDTSARGDDMTWRQRQRQRWR